MVSDLFSARSASLATARTNASKQEQFLRFYLVPDTRVMLPVSQLTEVLTIPTGYITPIPHLPSWVMGVYNWRGEILWMVDLGHLLGLTPAYQQMASALTYKAIVLQSASGQSRAKQAKKEMLGLVISRVEDIEWCDPGEIQSPPASAITPSLARFLRGYWLKANGDMIITLDGQAILAAMPKT